MSGGKHTTEFVKSGRGKAQYPADPEFPDGKDVDCSRPGAPSCKVVLPYPAPECGMIVVTCHTCKMSIGVTAAGRPDDARSLKMPCAISQN